VTILEDNIAPRAALQFTQGGSAVGATFDDSPIMIDAMASDANGAQVLSCDWSGTDSALMHPGIEANCGATPSWPVAVPVAGNYLIDVVVADNGSPAKSIRASRILHVDEVAAVTLGVADDSDMDGDFDAAEGFADDDGDGIPAYLDAIDASNLIPDQTVDMTKVLLLETEPGLTLRRGTTTQAANLSGALVSDLDIARFGSVSGDAPINSDDELEHVGGIYDFEIDGLIPGTSARIVIPLQSAIPKDARYRKYNPATGWSDFVVDTNNQVESATGELGACPEPGSSAYLSGLNYLDNCIQLTIQDGGPNDTDNQANGVINDPATVGVEITEPEGFDEVEDGSGGGRMSPLLLTMLLVFGGLAFWRRRRGFSID
jgi:MYXO-CTERM domain-containing protein